MATTTTHGVQLGSMAPDFALTGSTGHVSLADYRGKQSVVVYFMREFTCALSRKNVRQLKHLYPTLQACDAQVLVIGSGSRAEAQQLAATLQVHFPLLADADRAVYRRYGLEKVLGVWQRNGTVIVDRDGRVTYLHLTTIPTALDEAAVLKALA
jgi:peroxiredoxin